MKNLLIFVYGHATLSMPGLILGTKQGQAWLEL